MSILLGCALGVLAVNVAVAGWFFIAAAVREHRAEDARRTAALRDAAIAEREAERARALHPERRRRE